MFFSYFLEATKHLPASSTYQVLVGKRTATTLFFSFQHGLDPFFNSLPNLKKSDYQRVRENSQTSGPPQEALWTLAKGRAGYLPIKHRQVRENALLSWLQALSYLAHGQHQVAPLYQHEPSLQWVRWFLQAYRSELSYASIYQEWLGLLASLPKPLDAWLMALFFGYKLPPMLLADWPPGVHWPRAERQFLREAALDYCYQYFIEGTSATLTGEFLRAVAEGNPAWNASATVTYQGILAGLTLPAIAQARQLKESTIADHFIEIALRAPRLFLPIFKERINEAPKRAPKDYATFTAHYPEEPYWLFRYWHILKIYEERGEAFDLE